MSNPLLTFDPTETPLHPTLEETAAFATFAHGTQTDKAGQPYHLHLVRVARHLRRLFSSVSRVELHAVWLHDLLEDTEITERDLKGMGYADEVIATVRALTKPKDKSVTYADWIDNLARCGQAPPIRIKIADLTDNLDPARLAHLPEAEEASLSKRYSKALQKLQDAINAPEMEDTLEDQVVGLLITLPAMDRWMIEEAARIADRTTNEFILEEMIEFAQWITAQGHLKDIPLARTRAEENRAFVEAFVASERKHAPIREWLERQKRKDESK
ncbi:MAG: hypothetical protein AAF714_07070 [Pseudomonadota bacterium]